MAKDEPDGISFAQRPVVLFDFDGTLANTAPPILRTVRRVMELHGLPPAREEDLLLMIGPPLEEGFQLVSGISFEEARACTADYRAIFDQTVTPEDYALFDGVRELVNVLAASGRRLAVATSRMESSAHAMVAELGLDCFDAVMGRVPDVRYSKADCIRDALAALGADASEAVMVGDRHHDVDGARELGLPCIGVYTGTTPAGEHEAAGAAAVCTSVEQLADVLGVGDEWRAARIHTDRAAVAGAAGKGAAMDSELMADVRAYVDDVWDDVVSDIAALVAVPSVADAAAAKPGAPFGQPVREALDCALGIASKLGYAVSDDDGYMGIADIPGACDTQVATIAHVDVVPAGPGWSTDPFTLAQRDGWLIGRGVIDDKGPAVLSLYAGAYLLRRGIAPRYTFRALLGCDEEVGMTDVHHYLEGHADPAFLFTPDAEFPVCNAEKGCFGAVFESAPITRGRIHLWSGAEAANAIPAQSVCELAVKIDDLPAPVKNADRLTFESLGLRWTRIVAQGIGGHASLPAGSLNAIGIIVDYLREADILEGEERAFVDLLAEICADTDGAALGIASESPAFGPLTLCAGTIEQCDGRLRQTIDVRYPDSITAEQILASCQEVAARFGATCELTRAKEPFSVSADHPAVQVLLDTYAEVTGKDAAPFSMGGGTYARNFARAVSFGPEVPGTELPEWGGPMHGPNEVASEAQLKEALIIYILALLRLMELDL